MVSGSPSVASEGGGAGIQSAPLFTYTQQFEENFPYYLAIGMTEEQYWDGDPQLAKSYRKAEEIRNEKKNQEMWLQGLYIYEALCDAAPLFHDLAKKGTKAHKYTEKPYAITKSAREQEAEAKEKAVFNKGMRFMETLMASSKKKYSQDRLAEKKEVNGDGNS